MNALRSILRCDIIKLLMELVKI